LPWRPASRPRALAETLDREKARPPAEFAKVISSSASAFIRNVGRTRNEQRARVARSAEAAEVAPIRRPISRRYAARHRRERSSSVSTAPATAPHLGDGTQVEKQLELPEDPQGDLRDAVGTLKSAKAAYDSQNKFAGDNVKLANDTLANAMSGGRKRRRRQCQNAAKPPEAKKDGPVAQEIPNDFIVRAGHCRQADDRCRGQFLHGHGPRNDP
jgi:hypothetical protein